MPCSGVRGTLPNVKARLAAHRTAHSCVESPVKQFAAYVAGVVVLLVGLAPQADAAKTNVRFRPVGMAVGPVVTGQRYAAYPLDFDTVRVVDSLTGVRLTIDHPSGCDLAAMSGRLVLWNCFKPRPNARVLDIETGIVREPQFDPSADTARNFTSVGKRWVAGTATGPGYTDASFYVNWRTGERRGTSAVGAGSYPDLDSESLARRLCAPLRRPRSGSYDPDNPDLFGDPFDEYQYERPYGLRRVFDGEQFTLALDSCGRRARHPVTKRPFASEQLVAGKVTYAKPGSVQAFLPRSGRRFTWKVSSIERRGERSADVRHTAYRIYVSVPALSGPRWWIYSAPWPR